MTNGNKQRINIMLREDFGEIVEKVYLLGGDIREMGAERDGQALQEIGRDLENLCLRLLEKYKTEDQ